MYPFVRQRRLSVDDPLPMSRSYIRITPITVRVIAAIEDPAVTATIPTHVERRVAADVLPHDPGVASRSGLNGDRRLSRLRQF